MAKFALGDIVVSDHPQSRGQQGYVVGRSGFYADPFSGTGYDYVHVDLVENPDVRAIWRTDSTVSLRAWERRENGRTHGKEKA